MIDDYLTSQSVAHRIITNSVKNNKLSHAYIIESNGYDKAYDFALALAKTILCKNNITKKCALCNQCMQIEKNEFLELKILETDNLTIKKEQVEKVQNELSTKAIIGSRKLYLIKDAAKLNSSSSNALLKILEEPEDNIFSILIVNNINELLNTIVSRCQVIKLKNNYRQDLDSVINEYCAKTSIDYEEANNSLNIIEKFIIDIENIGLDAMNFSNEIFKTFLINKNSIDFFFYVIILFYKDVINYKLKKQTEIFPRKYLNTIILLANKNNLSTLSNKIKKVVNLKRKINLNANDKLLIDRLIIELVGD